ncbi:unnamed protein product [Lathyrus sativus]|nr:unnamed protein product [Lathyrus sativus]
MVGIPLFTIDDGIPACGLESRANADAQQQPAENRSLISVDDILGSVFETTHHVGRISVSAPSNMPYKEMALHCEALLAGKQQNISTFMGANSLHGYSFRIFAPTNYNHEKDKPTNSNVQQSLPLVNGNSFLDSPNTLPETVPSLRATSYQQEDAFFQLPASRPYVNFLKAAGC